MQIKRNQILNVMLFVYVTVGLLILFFDLGKKHFGIYFSEKINQFVPSILPTAAITPMPESSALILSLAWLMVPIIAVVIWLNADWDRLYSSEFSIKISGWLVLGISVLLPILIVFMIFNVPAAEDTGRSGQFLYTYLNEFKLFIIVYGAGIWLTFSAGIFTTLAITKLSLFKKV